MSDQAWKVARRKRLAEEKRKAAQEAAVLKRIKRLAEDLERLSEQLLDKNDKLYNLVRRPSDRKMRYLDDATHNLRLFLSQRE